MAIESLSDIIKGGQTAFSTGGGSGGTPTYIGPNPPLVPVVDMMWVDSSIGKSYYYYSNGGTPVWVDFLSGLNGPRGKSFFERRIQVIDNTINTVVCNWDLYDEIRISLAGDITLLLQGGQNGQGCTLKLKQSLAGSNTVTIPSNVRFNNDVVSYSISIESLKSDRIGFIRDTIDNKFDFVSVIKGF